MNTTVFSDNLKKFRIAKKLTQEEVAASLCVNAQTISRWECGTTLPDVLTLPAIAKLYGVTTDDLYRKHSVAYDNYAQRLSAVYEKTRDPEDFIRCRLEYQKQMKDDVLSIADKWNYATIHHFMFRFCKDTALEWYDKAIADGFESNPHIYMRARSLRNCLLFEVGKREEAITRQKEQCALHPDDPKELIFLMEAYIWAENYNEAYAVFRNAINRFPDNWLFYIHGGDICKALKKYDEAFIYWNKAGDLGTDFYDECYCMAACYNDLGEYEKAYSSYKELAEKLRRDHYDVEAEMAELEAEKIRMKMNP